MATSPTIKIKKYPNRRLYDTVNSTYVTLNQVSDLIKAGHQVKVVDAKSKEDVTAFILTQIIMEQAKNGSWTLPVSLLHLVIQFGESVLNDFFEKYLEKTIQNYLAYRHTMDEQFERYLDLGLNLSQMTQKTIKELTPLAFAHLSSKNLRETNNKKDKG
ncbi:MAG: polyhydroxyalkanoate synthesis regulator DNA-binding domain-containing protein [Desulfobacterales bacterium]|nr:MAG: polyhydroxyalkanoate synthesis regulator DNA-binding domain-containing protein [Desulfobacterales bacterium]